MPDPKERQIIFSAPMVRALLDGRKTQTRRIVKPAPRWVKDAGTDPRAYVLGMPWYDDGKRSGIKPWPGAPEVGVKQVLKRCPYGQPGDRLWVRETFTLESSRNLDWYDPPHTDGRPLKVHEDEHFGRWWQQPHYRATDPAPELMVGENPPGCKWVPCLHMPRWASRLTLEVTGHRIERLNDISAADAAAEGLKILSKDGGRTWKYGIPEADGLPGPDGWDWRDWDQDPRVAFRTLWERINGRGGWDANPFVWVVEFRVIAAPGAAGGVS